MTILNLTSSLTLLLLTSPALLAEPTPPSSPIEKDPLVEALPILQSKYVDFKALNYEPSDHLSDLIARSSGEISLTAPATPAAPLPILTATLPNDVIYWRLASFTPEKSWLDLEAQLGQAGASALGVILDLRSNVASDDYQGAAQVLSFFAPADAALSKYNAMGANHAAASPSMHLPMVVLINHETTGAAEALAACLKTDGALLVGRETRGQAAVFAEQKLSSGQILRFAVQNVFQADGTPLFGHPVVPDISLNVDDHSEKAALVLIKDNHVSDVIQESPERHRLSEATLVQGQDPEWDDYLASLEKRPVLLSLPVIHDEVLISALDSLKAIRLSQRTLPTDPTANASLPASSSIQ